MDAEGTWSLPWPWTAAGTYRVYADFVPDTDEALTAITLTRTVEVAGDVHPRDVPAPTKHRPVDGYTVTLDRRADRRASSQLTCA